MGGFFGGVGLGLLSQGASSAFNYAMSRRQMRFQREMANTVHQREIRDLEKAGLNPILSAKYGGNPSPPGAMAVAPASNLASSAREGVAASMLKQQVQAQIDLARVQSAKVAQETRLVGAEADKAEVSKLPYRAVAPMLEDPSSTAREAWEWIKRKVRGIWE